MRSVLLAVLLAGVLAGCSPGDTGKDTADERSSSGLAPVVETSGSPDCTLLTRAEAQAATSLSLPLTFTSDIGGCGYGSKGMEAWVDVERFQFKSKDEAITEYRRVLADVNAHVAQYQDVYQSNFRANQSLFTCKNGTEVAYHFVHNHQFVTVGVGLSKPALCNSLKATTLTLGERILPRL